MNPTVAIVILNWNGRKFLEQFLPSVMASTYLHKKVIVADNASSDDSVSFIQSNYPHISLLINKKNEGFAGGYNWALKQVEADYYVLLNSDVEVTPRWIEPIIDLMESDEKIGACQPKLLSFQNRDEFEYAGASGGFIDCFGYPLTRGRVFDVHEKDEGQYDDAVPCFWASGAALFVRAKLYHEVGGLDAYFFAHQEEIDLCWRMQLAGYKIYVQPNSIVYHVGGGTLPKGNSRKVYLNFRNNLIMMAKNLPFWSAFLKIKIRLHLDILAALKGIFSGDAGYAISVIKAHWGFFRWLVKEKYNSKNGKRKMKDLTGVIQKSILTDYFFRGKRKFSEIMKLK